MSIISRGQLCIADVAPISVRFRIVGVDTVHFFYDAPRFVRMIRLQLGWQMLPVIFPKAGDTQVKRAGPFAVCVVVPAGDFGAGIGDTGHGILRLDDDGAEIGKAERIHSEFFYPSEFPCHEDAHGSSVGNHDVEHFTNDARKQGHHKETGSNRGETKGNHERGVRGH